MADTIFYGGDIITMSSNIWEQEAVAVSQGRVVDVGKLADISKLKTVKTNMVDLGGATLLPGLIEPHTHCVLTAVHRSNHPRAHLDISGFTPTTQKEVRHKLHNLADNAKKDEWLVATGLNPMLIPGVINPSLKKMDALTSDHPLLLYSQNQHSVFCNSKALSDCDITKDTPDPPGGAIMHDDRTGELTGELKEIPARDSLIRHLNLCENHSYSHDIIQYALENYARCGCTTVGDLGNMQEFDHDVDIFEELASSPGCPVRVVLYNQPDTMTGVERGVPGKDNLCHMGVKMWADGSPYCGTMALDEPYLDTKLTREELFFPEPPNRGMLVHTEDEMYETMLPLHKSGWQLATHVQGDRAAQQTLDVYSRLLQAYPRPDHRHRLEHCGLITASQIEQARQLDVCLSFYPDHIHYFGRHLRDGIIGPERAARFAPMGTALSAGHKPTFHADSPCTPTNIFRTMKTVVTRSARRELPSERYPEGHEPEVIGPDQAISVDEALKACTVHAAYQLFHEKLIGSVEPGKLADFTVVSENPRRIDPYELDAIDIVCTYREGRKVMLSPAM